MEKMRKTVLGILYGMLIASMAVFANGKTEKSPSDNGQTDTLKVWIAGAGDNVTGTAYNKIFDVYAAKTGTKVELTFIPWSDYFTKLNTGLISGVGGPDVFMSGYGQFGTLLTNDYLLPLDSYIPKDWEGYTDIPENILNASKYNGKYYGLFYANTRCLLYRKDIALQNGVTDDELHIKSPQDFINLVRKLTVYDANGKVKTYGFDIKGGGTSEVEQFFVGMADMYEPNFKLWDDQYNPTFNTEGAKKGWMMLNDLYKEGVACLRDPGAKMSGVVQGTAAMTLSAETDYANADAAFPGNIGVVKDDMNTLLIGDYFVVNKNTPYKQQAVDLLLHMFNKESWKTQMDVRMAYPVIKSLIPEYKSKNPDNENIAYSFEHAHPFSSVPYSGYNAGIQVLRDNLETVFHGVSMDDAMAKMVSGWNKVRAEQLKK